MQAVSAALDAAILASVREPVIRLRVDWDRSGSYTDLAVKDLSADAMSASLSRELATDLPAQAKLFAGLAAAEATITLDHRDLTDPDRHGAWYYSGLNTASPLYAYNRKGAPATLEYGFVTSNGLEYVTVLTGRVRSLQVTSGGRQATMRISDGAEDLRRQITLPMVVADGEKEDGTALRPGLSTTWIANHILRACHYYAQPPPRSNVKFLATMAGSCYPEVGKMVSVEGAAGTQPGFEPTAAFPGPARWVTGMGTSSTAAPEIRYNLAGSGLPSANNGSTILVEGWYRWRSTTINQPLWVVWPGGSGHYVSAYWQQSTGRLTVTFNRGGGAQSTVVGPVIAPGTSSYHYVGIHVSFASTGVTAIFRYDGTTTSPAATATTSITGTPLFDTIAVDHGRVDSFVDAQNSMFQEAVQLTTEASPGTWNDAFIPTADVRASAGVDSKILATPQAPGEAWSLLQEVAGAEFATAGFTELGMPFYWPRDRWTTAPYTTSQRTLAAETALAELATTEALDQVKNHIVIRTDTPQVQAPGEVWRMGHLGGIGAGSTATLWAEFNDPVANLDTSVIYSGLPADGSRYLAGTNRDGSGTQVSNLTFTVTSFVTSAKIVISNPNGFPVWLTVDANAASTYFGTVTGKPYLVLNGQAVTFGAGDTSARFSIDAIDSASIAAYGPELLLELPASPFRQDFDQVTGIANDLLAALAFPRPALSDIPAVGDPRLQLGDRLTVVDTDGLGFTADFHLSKILLTVDVEEGLAMTLSLRGA